MARFEINAGDRAVRIYEIFDEVFTIGSDPGAGLRLVVGGVLPSHLELRRAKIGYQVRAKGGPFRHQGVQVTKAELRDGDTLEIGTASLIYLDETAPPEPKTKDLFAAAAKTLSIGAEIERVTAARQRGERSQKRAIARGRSSTSKGGMPRVAFVSTMLTASAVVIFVIVKLLSSAAPTRSPADMLTLAENQLSQGQPAKALDTLEIAGREAGGGPVVERIRDLKDRIEAMLRRQADQDTVDHARRAKQALIDFERIHVARDPSRRAVTRELVRVADAWLAEYAPVLDKYDDMRHELVEVRTLRERHQDAARLSGADDAEDVLFAVERLLRTPVRPYREAIERLDAFLRSNQQDPRRQEVAERRDRLATEGKAWFLGRLAEVERTYKRGQFDNARSMLSQLRTQTALPTWDPEAAAVAAQLDATEQEWERAKTR